MIKTVFGASLLLFCYSFLFIQFALSLVSGFGSGFNAANFVILLIMSPFVYGYLREVIKLEGAKPIGWLIFSTLLSVVFYVILYYVF